MKTVRLPLRGVLAAATFSLLFISCDKNPIAKILEEKEATVLSAETDVTAEAAFDDVFNNVMGVNDEVGMAGTGAFGRVNEPWHCYTVTATKLDAPRTFPLKIVVDFGTGCTGRNGVLRKGKIITTYSNRLTVKDATAVTTFEGFSVNGVKLEGTHTITQLGSINDTLKFGLKIENAVVTKENGEAAAWQSTKTLKQIGGNSTLYQPGDDVYSLTGESNGTVTLSGNEYSWSKRVINPLIKANSCEYIQSGSVGISRNGKENTINFGDGTCDNKATITINGISVTITLR
ncbi:hypothetical protein [Parasegetibacter sp. NRK P23]|uniref:hypothetical protein n=1 Tax=Parasegetibacter sp. NRK P23 TaxID=2942999 RepID=UPI002043C39E|nr:hypothetical protein [Parasegetibacter sp. NRK P23]MCM5530241.1 hypothetical protein [Parasegetibacter sp. NRK P23]